ncbi:MAG: hypothetical protein V4574_02865 [Pseudomonadota bacterium]
MPGSGAGEAMLFAAPLAGAFDAESRYQVGRHDTVRASVSYSLAGQFVENLELSGTAAINGTGNSLANVIQGNDAANLLSGSDGDDMLHGAGADTLTGGNGADGFWFDAVPEGDVDSITDFNVAADTIYFDPSGSRGARAR